MTFSSVILESNNHTVHSHKDWKQGDRAHVAVPMKNRAKKMRIFH